MFSGDLGRHDDLLMPPPEPPPPADVMIVESTYGNRVHPAEDSAALLADIVNRTVQRGGSVLLPSFAVGRAQALLLVLQRLRRAGLIPRNVPIFLDSPMALEATALYRRHGRAAARAGARGGDAVRRRAHGDHPQQSMRLSASRYPAIIISASGMATGGRVLHHLKAQGARRRNDVVFPGFQVGGSRGAQPGGRRHAR